MGNLIIPKIDSLHTLNVWSPLGNLLVEWQVFLNGQRHPFVHSRVLTLQGDKPHTEQDILRSLASQGKVTLRFVSESREKTYVFQAAVTCAKPMTDSYTAWILMLEGQLEPRDYLGKFSTHCKMACFYDTQDGTGFALVPEFAKQHLLQQTARYRQWLQIERAGVKGFSLLSNFATLTQAIDAGNFGIKIGLAETPELILAPVGPVDVNVLQVDMGSLVKNPEFLARRPRIVSAMEFLTFAAMHPEEYGGGELSHMYHTVWEIGGRMFWALIGCRRQEGKLFRYLEIREGDNSNTWIEEGMLLIVVEHKL